ELAEDLPEDDHVRLGQLHARGEPLDPRAYGHRESAGAEPDCSFARERLAREPFRGPERLGVLVDEECLDLERRARIARGDGSRDPPCHRPETRAEIDDPERTLPRY